MGDKLADIVSDLGNKGVITDLDLMKQYLADLQGLEASLPVAVLRPSTTKQTVACIKWCIKHDFAVVPQGGLTGLCGAAVPTGEQKTAIISLQRMNKIRNIDPLGKTMTVEAGMVLADVKSAAMDAGLYFPLSHGAEGSSQIGGNLSTNSGGNNALRYGTARDQVLGLEVVLPDATVWNGLKALHKNTAGYDLKHLFIGAEGTLGLITAAVLKLRSYPHNRATAFVSLNTPLAAQTLLKALDTQLGGMVSAFELISSNAISFALTIEGVRYPLAEPAAWNVLIEVETSADGFDICQALEAGLGEAMEQEIINDAVVAQSTTQREALWYLRECVATAFVEDKSVLKSDTGVPVEKVADYIDNTTAEIEKFLPGARSSPF